MRSEYHNLPSFNGVSQNNGRTFEATNCEYDESNGSLKLDLTSAYPEEAKLESYTRRAVLENGEITVTDNFILKDEGNAVFNLITRTKPQNVTDIGFEIENRSVIFDKSLCFNVEEIDCTAVETKRLPILWDTEKLWRITLSTPTLDGGKNHCFTLKIK